MKNSIRVGMLVGSTALLGSLAHADQWSDKFPHIKNTQYHHFHPLIGEHISITVIFTHFIVEGFTRNL